MASGISAGGADEAPGFEMVGRGLQGRHANDGALLAAAVATFDAVYAAMQKPDEH